MSVAAAQSSGTMHRVSMVTLVVGVLVSLMIHLGVGLGAGRYFGSARHSFDSAGRAIEMDPAVSAMPKPDEVHLGAQDASRASINWLGVVEDPEAGDAPVAEVEQAAFTKQVGDSTAAVSPMPEAEPMPRVEEVPVQVPVQEPVEELVQEEVQEAVEEVADDEVVPEQALAQQVEIEAEPDESAPVVIETQPEPVEEPAQEQAEESEEAQKSESPIEPAVEPAIERVVEPVVSNPSSNPSPSSEAVSLRTAGKEGVVSKKESAASIIKRAIKVDASKLNKPIVGKGLEIITVEPKFPASVRFTEMPRNPVLMIRFNGSGRVSKAYFLKEGRRVYDTGVVGVDEPLMSAVYQWRAKGKQIDALDRKDPESVVEISMRIVFHKEAKKP